MVKSVSGNLWKFTAKALMCDTDSLVTTHERKDIVSDRV